MSATHRFRFPGRILARIVLLAVSGVVTSSAAPSAPASQLSVVRSDDSVLELEWTMREPALETVPTAIGAARRPLVEGGVFLGAPGTPDLPSVMQLVGVPSWE
ncbi:hypothetical protein K8I85_09185, partial [bacterium]|nr:hypothetical protein [bacterium]